MLDTGKAPIEPGPKDADIIWRYDMMDELGVFPHNASYNPTGPVGALAYWTADAIKNRYVKNPGPLVQA